jgi:hypothetical protein
VTVEVPLSRGLVAVIDDEDADAVLAHGKWHTHSGRRTFYAARNVRRDDGSRTLLLLHTFLTGWSRVDHRNGDGLDNRRVNLRPTSVAGNQRNQSRRVNNASGYKGVVATGNRWRAEITCNYEARHLGLFLDPISAARAYDAAARELHGAFARTNFPEESA